MIINTELSAAARAGALDASLAFSSVYTQHSDLVSQTALSGLKGLQSLITESGVYAMALNHLKETTQSVTLANAQAALNPFLTGSQSTVNSAFLAGLAAQANALTGQVNNAQTAASNALSGLPDGTIKNAAQGVKNAADAVVNARAALAGGNASQVASALASAQSAQSTAQTVYNNTPAAPAAAKAQALAVLNAANQVLAAANAVSDLRNSSIGRLIGVTPNVTDMGNGYSLSTWGSIGLVTITGPDGAGILIDQNGNVDPLNGAGEGWKFNNTSTFILPGDTKVTFTPGNPASILASRGVHAFTVGNIANGQNANTSDYSSLNGRIEDRASNDGHILQLQGTGTANWTLGGALLGDAGSREVVATSAVNNELKLDPTDITVSADLTNFIASLGLTAVDYDSDGKLNNEELAQLSVYISKYVEQLQTAYNEALSRITQANTALFELNVMLEEIRKQGSNLQDDKSAENAAARAELQAVEKRLVAALQLLRGGDPAEGAQQQGNVEKKAEAVLDQLTKITQQGGLQAPVPTGPAASTQPTPPVNTSNNGSNGSGAIETLGQPVGEQQSNALGDSLRRAGRLLSGLSQLNILELPATPPAGGAQGAPALPGSLDALAAALAGAVQELGGSGAPISAQALEAGLGGLLTALGAQGALDLGGLQGAEDLPALLNVLSAQLGGLGTTETQTQQGADKLLSFLGLLAAFGSASNAVAPQAGLTTPGQVEQAGTGSLKPQDAAARQLALVLAGLAELGSAGAQQSSKNQGADAPTSAELRLGLQAFLAAFAALGVFGTNQAQDQQSLLTGLGQGGITFPGGNTQQIATISGNFYTDPELMKQLDANLNRAIQVQSEQLSRASTLFSQSQEIVQKFVNLVKEDDLIREIVTSDELSDEQQDMFADKMSDLRKDWGMEWGSDENRTPASQSSLVSKAVQSGMMV